MEALTRHHLPLQILDAKLARLLRILITLLATGIYMYKIGLTGTLNLLVHLIRIIAQLLTSASYRSVSIARAVCLISRKVVIVYNFV